MAHIEPVSFEQYKAKALAQFKPSNAVDCTDWEGLYAEYLKRATKAAHSEPQVKPQQKALQTSGLTTQKDEA